MMADACQFVQFTLVGQQLGLRTVPTTTISSNFPTFPDLEQRFKLLQRTGETLVMAVGSGAAIDLAKGLHAERSNSLERVILWTGAVHLGAMIASRSSQALFLDGIKETFLVPMPKQHQNDGNFTDASPVGGGITVASSLFLDGRRRYMELADDLREFNLCCWGIGWCVKRMSQRPRTNPARRNE
jgi:hypothetical protein